jgi:hypothetical protein
LQIASETHPINSSSDTPGLHAKYGQRFSEIPTEAISICVYLHDRVSIGLRQLMAGNRRWKLDLIGRGDLISLSELAKGPSNTTADKVEKEAVKKILE